MRLTRDTGLGMMVDMRDFLIEPTSAEGERILAKPDRFLVPIAQLPDRSFIIPNSTAIVILEFRPGPREHTRAHAWRFARGLCWAGVPVFGDQERIRVYCPCVGALAIRDAFLFYKENIAKEAELLRNHVELYDIQGVARIVGQVNHKLDGNVLTVEGVVRSGNVAYRTFSKQYLLPEGAILL